MKKFLTFIVLATLSLSCMAQNNTENIVHSEVMAWSNITGVRLDGELIDIESALCVGVLGGKVEKRVELAQGKATFDLPIESFVTLLF